MSAPRLRALQRWFAHIVEHPATADVAMRSRVANALIPSADVAAGRVIEPNPRLDAAGMLQVYNGAYLARLVEVLQGDFGAVQHVLGEHQFQQLVARYLAVHPSRHPNLNHLGEHLPAFVRKQRRLPHRAFLAELATLERACEVAFDAPEFTPLALATFGDVPPERWAGARFTANPSVQLFAFRHPVDAFYQDWKEGAARPVPSPEASWLVVFRRDDRVWRQRLPRGAHAVLGALVAGQPLAQALARAGRSGGDGRPVTEWFQSFAADGLFTAVDFG